MLDIHVVLGFFVGFSIVLGVITSFLGVDAFSATKILAFSETAPFLVEEGHLALTAQNNESMTAMSGASMGLLQEDFPGALQAPDGEVMQPSEELLEAARSLELQSPVASGSSAPKRSEGIGATHERPYNHMQVLPNGNTSCDFGLMDGSWTWREEHVTMPAKFQEPGLQRLYQWRPQLEASPKP